MTSLSSKVAAILLGFSVAAAPGALLAKDRLTVDLVNEPSSLDPQVQWNPDSYYVYRNIFDNLLTRDDKGDIIPQVATSWKYLSDTEIEFQIRDDITFHDGKKLTAEDVAFSVQRITDPKFGSPQLGQFNKIIKAEATSPTTVKLTTDGAYPALLAQLTKLSIVPKHVVEALGKDAFNLKPIGSGPYKFDNWQRGVQVTLTANADYWGDKGPFPTAVFRAVPDASTRVANLQAGTSDIAVTLDSDLAEQLKSSARAKVLSVLTERVAYLRLNPTKAPFDNTKVRQAVAYAIDKDGLIDGILGGYDKPVPEMLTPSHVGWVADIKAPSYDLAKAKALVAEAGPAAKAEIELATSPVFDQRIVQAIQQMLAEAGLNVKINMSDMANYLKRAQGGVDATPALSFGRWSCSCQDADGVLFPLLHKSSSWSVYRNDKADALLEDARATLDEKKRLEDYRQVHEIVAEDVPLVPLYQVAAIYGAAKPLQWQPSPGESLFLNRMSWKE
ncbi:MULTISPECIES: ABC transporter substrate-binding protein [unclassified Chelatococcus]|jgi:peptide/nickel transport system substrate-binding protein|uniref:ABC transporter substrate-binding protein n=1 Tax=unclassified Chelatococcus TaxID=2638111 RepID=UPI001BD13328|nr:MULTISPECIES: ABC transporter substrate-binding protein [unclassified Chelatococcus]CAH1650519.1 Peptide/nickel transport system substrate-binding protein [Hyphomicrobiales bacterium]MBS7743295.1 peptide ABC transporter [Chelatococcus sp. HY11]MBX3541587.1 peptide ABC transporter [Chelatococcus sp.]MCO5074521.1 ABC transporter substrate-binding protein [Chelatococcus sp.]CAH1692709.1 Peptide/nickel transport system substrate-binding protein [Hyphomicrobiales bacterium]